MHAVVLTWNGAHLLPECLAALRGQDARARLNVVVVDNASSDGTAELLAREFPEVEHLRLAENAGYGRANNQAMHRALHAGADFSCISQVAIVGQRNHSLIRLHHDRLGIQ